MVCVQVCGGLSGLSCVELPVWDVDRWTEQEMIDEWNCRQKGFEEDGEDVER